MSRPVCANCLCLIDEYGCGCIEEKTINANELADELDEYAGNSGFSHIDYEGPMRIAATVLREQQAEIEKLQAELVEHDDCIWLIISQNASRIVAYRDEIEALKDEVAEWKMSYENCHRMCSGYGMN